MELDGILTALIIGLAATVFATFGFGDALLAMPLLSMLLGVKTAAPLMAITGILLSVAVMGRNWQHIAWRDAAHLLVAALPGIPIGIYGLKYANETAMQLLLGLVIMGIVVFNWRKPQQWQLKDRRWAYLFGFVGGILGGAYNTSGPPIVIYGTLRRWHPARFVGTLQGFFLPLNLIVIVGHYWAGTLTATVGHYYLYCLPALLVALAISAWLHRCFDVEEYRKYVFVILFLSGALLLLKSMAALLQGY